jgi:hypothetical protein
MSVTPPVSLIANLTYTWIKIRIMALIISDTSSSFDPNSFHSNLFSNALLS